MNLLIKGNNQGNSLQVQYNGVAPLVLVCNVCVVMLVTQVTQVLKVCKLNSAQVCNNSKVNSV